MTTRAQLLSAIRVELNDSGGTALWTSALLNSYIVDAIREYSRQLPQEASTTIDTVADQAAYPLPARAINVSRVEEPYASRAIRYRGERHLYSYRVYGGTIILEPAPPSSVAADLYIEYSRSYAEPSADSESLATPATSDDVLIWLVCARALDWIGTDESKRQRWEQSRGASAGGQSRAYRARAIAFFANELRVVRSSSLSATDDSAPNPAPRQDTDPGP